MLSTTWSRDFGLRVPIVNAPMGGVAGGRLAAAVSAAGGLGMVGMGSDGSRAALKIQLQHVSGRFGIGLVDWVMRSEAGLLDDALAAGPALLSVSFGTDLSWVARAHDAGIPTVTQVYTDVVFNSDMTTADTIRPALFNLGLPGPTNYFINASSTTPSSRVTLWRWTDPFGANVFEQADD